MHHRRPCLASGSLLPANTKGTPAMHCPMTDTINALGRAPAPKEANSPPGEGRPGRPAMAGSRVGADPQSRGLRCPRKLVLPARAIEATKKLTIAFHKVIKSISNRRERRKKVTRH